MLIALDRADDDFGLMSGETLFVVKFERDFLTETIVDCASEIYCELPLVVRS